MSPALVMLLRCCPSGFQVGLGWEGEIFARWVAYDPNHPDVTYAKALYGGPTCSVVYQPRILPGDLKDVV